MNAPRDRNATTDPRAAALEYQAAMRLIDVGLDAEASKRLDAAIRLHPEFAEAYSLGAYVLERGGKPESAVRFYRRALELNPALPAAWANLAKLLFRQGAFVEALEAVDRTLQLQPRDADAFNTRAGVLRALWRLEEAARAAQMALTLQPRFPEAALNLGSALLKSNRPAEALDAYRLAEQLRPRYGDAICGQALALRALSRLDAARAAFDRAAALGCREAVSGRGCLDLMLGNFAEGWEGYEARWVDGKSIAEAIGARYPLWRGPGAPPRRVLVINDHGLGDTIQFARYLPLMRKAGATPYFLAPAKLHKLIGLLVEGRIFEVEPADVRFDAQIAISSLPRAFGTRLDSIPAETPYLVAEPERVERWARRLEAGESRRRFRVGCVWQGNPNPDADIARAFPLSELAALARIEGVRLIALQRGYGEEQLTAETGFAVERLAPDYDTGGDAFLDAAAVMKNLDLVVTCDTSIAHLAGALAVPGWVALKRDAEWRWLRERSDSPWYPSLRLFRQSKADEWGPVFAAMAEALQAARNGASLAA